MRYVIIFKYIILYCVNFGPYTSGVPYRADSVPCFRTLSGQHLWVMVLLFRVTGRFVAEVLQLNIVQAGLIDVAL